MTKASVQTRRAGTQAKAYEPVNSEVAELKAKLKAYEDAEKVAAEAKEKEAIKVAELKAGGPSITVTYRGGSMDTHTRSQRSSISVEMVSRKRGTIAATLNSSGRNSRRSLFGIGNSPGANP